MSNLIPASSATAGGLVLGGGAPSAWTTQGRALSRLVASSELQVARLVETAHVESAKLTALDHVTQRAMQGAALVAQLEGQLAEAVPTAAFRLAQIGQAHALAMVGEVHNFSRQVQ